MLGVILQGGLGNQLFQLAAAETIASETNRNVYMLDKNSPYTSHSTSNYFLTIFSKFLDYPIIEEPYVIVDEPSFKKYDWNQLIPEGPACIKGYFQNWRYISDDFISKLVLPECHTIDGAFIHIRGGDYVNNSLHHVDLTSYYKKAVEYFPTDTHFYIFTNDVQYAKTFTFLSKINHTFVNEDELMTLTMMSKCTKGGVCANSSFSWWGAFLNPNRTIVMPGKWFKSSDKWEDLWIEGYYFPGVTKIDLV